MSTARYAARLAALALVAAALLAALITGTVPADAGRTAQPAAVEVAEQAATATASFGTRAERDAYIRCVAPSTEVSLTLRVKLLTYAGRALEGIRAGVPASKVTAVLRAEYHLTTTEASKVYWCTVRVWG